MHDLILYTSDDGQVALQLRASDGTVWLSQLEIAELFASSKQNISLHIRNILAEGELADSVVKESLTTASDGKNYRTQLYNLDMILAVGYRVRSPRGTQFRQWATISAKVAEQLAQERYQQFDSQRREAERQQADSEDLHSIEQLQRQLPRKRPE